jgi:hypothetical protein
LRAKHFRRSPANANLPEIEKIEEKSYTPVLDFGPDRSLL